MNAHPAPVRRHIPADACESRWTAPDGHRLRRIDFAPVTARGSLLFLCGRGDAYEKYMESLDHWRGEGWHVTALDWRGQAGSGRLGSDAITGHVEHFGQWIDDLADFWSEWSAKARGPHVVVGHSMGGHLVLRAMAERRIKPAAAVLTAPMLGLAGPLPPLLAHGIAGTMVRFGDPRRPAWRWSEKPGELPAGREALLTHDGSRYADELYWREQRPGLVMGPGSWGWVKSAIASMRWLARADVLARVETPVLFVATDADRLVSPQAIRSAHGLLPDSRLIEFGPEAAHEILREVDAVRDRALAAIADFLNETAPAA